MQQPLPGAGLQTTPDGVASQPTPGESAPAPPPVAAGRPHSRRVPGCDGEFGSRLRAPSLARRSAHPRTDCR